MVKSIIIHGGAGSWKSIEPERAKLALETINRCLEWGWNILSKENNSVNAVVEAIKCMEDSGVLNAGWGSVLDLLGNRTLDAGIMSSNGLLGAVAAVSSTRNPIVLAKIVAEETPHVLIVGHYADQLAVLKKLPPLPPSPSSVVERYEKYLSMLLRGESSRPYIDALKKFFRNNPDYYDFVRKMKVFDTVGACAIDDNGVLTAGVSTGGLLLKLPGRVGDSAIPGAGFYASDVVACSATGIGEAIIRSMPCLKLSDLVKQGFELNEASDLVLKQVNGTVGSDTLGFIAVDNRGNIVWRFNTEGILIGYARNGKLYSNIELLNENGIDHGSL
ncbi:MAG: isoaspartyl peptidase/L-asparaginase [Desulfurococcaceae archaeon]